MHIDTSELENFSTIEGDLCVIGAGAAGISMALDWIGTGKSVILLEAGGFDYEPEIQELYQGENIGQRYYSLTAARLRFFGGTTNHWGGYCAPLDPIDFTNRAWVPHSGWPITFEDLKPYYPKAQELVEIPPHPWDLEYWLKKDPELQALPLDDKVMQTKIFQFSPPTKFGKVYRKAIVESKNVTLYTHANLTDIQINPSESAVRSCIIKSQHGHTHTVKAKHFVLAMGAIENARMLMASSTQAPNGLGNDYDQVGRYFMEHPEIQTGQLLLPAPGPMKLYTLEFLKSHMYGELTLSQETQQKEKVLNGTLFMHPTPLSRKKAWIDIYPKDGEGSLALMGDAVRNSKTENKPDINLSKYRQFQIQTRMEQAPNPASRVTLANEKDQLGVPKVLLNWQLTDLDKYTNKIMHQLLAMEVGKAGVGRLQIPEWITDNEAPWPSTLGGGWHHMGTTRMHDDPKQGVTDANGKVHGLENLHCAGSSCFTTGGAANPTLTLIALTLRLSEHLKTLTD
ncbi:MAG: FAD-dependent oxidoreductase [Cyclobacteriaceae bacterium]